ncbi:MAG: glycosyl transferase family protein [Sphingomonadales bacterium]|nr:glycosyl transferase family protein [Sphingomonadales bacterium]
MDFALGEWNAFYWLQLVEHELLIFALFWFILGMIDEMAIDIAWLWLRLGGRGGARAAPDNPQQTPLAGMIAIFIPAWQEAGVIGATVAHMLSAWPQRQVRIYVGCYANDAQTITAAMTGTGSDPRVRLVIHDRAGPTTKADCLNRLYHALQTDEARLGHGFRAVVLHDAEDMVHPAALVAIDRAMDRHSFVQLPVRPEPQPGSRWIAGHYADEFTEAHAKTMVVRGAMGAAIPAAGVGCGFARDMLANLARLRVAEGEAGPFAAECLTEDYELGLLVTRHGGQGRFLRLRDAQGALVATRSYFPGRLTDAVRQKTRWVHGIAFQEWERLGWSGRWVDLWIALRDRRGPLTALVLAAAYALVLVEGVLALAQWAGWFVPLPVTPLFHVALAVSFAGLLWRAAWRFAFTTREYGVIDGLRAVLRIPIGNIVAIMAGRRAFLAYFRSLRGEAIIWDKTMHDLHPAQLAMARSAR